MIPIKNILIVEGNRSSKELLLDNIKSEDCLFDFNAIIKLATTREDISELSEWRNGTKVSDAKVFYEPAQRGERFSSDVKVEFQTDEFTPLAVTRFLSKIFPPLGFTHYWIVNTNERAGMSLYESGELIKKRSCVWEEWRKMEPKNLIHALNVKYDKANYINALKLFMASLDKSNHYDQLRMNLYAHYLKLAEGHSTPTTLPPSGFICDSLQFMTI